MMKLNKMNTNREDDYMTEVALDLIPFLTLALIVNPKTINIVDNLYERYKFEAFQAAKESKYYNHPFLSDGSIKREVTGKRALGLLCLNTLEKYPELDLEIIELFKKGWKPLYNYISKTDVIEVDYIMSNIIEDKNDDDYFVAFTTILLLFSEMEDKLIEPLEFRHDIGFFFTSFLEHYESDKDRFSYKFVKRDKELFNKAQSIADRFYENFLQLKTTCDLNELIILDDDLSDYCRSVSVIFDSDKMSLSSMSDNVKIDRKDIVELAGLYYIHNKNQHRLESAKFILFGLHLKYSINAYINLKKYYFKNNKETLFFEIETYIKDIDKYKEVNLLLNKNIENIQNENTRLKNEYKNTIEKENILLVRENLKLKETILTLEKEKSDLVELNNSFFEEFDENNDIEDMALISNDISLDEIDIKVVIAGGHSTWQSRLKESLPNSYSYIEGDHEQFDERLIDNIEHVFIYTKYMSHGFYYKLMEKVKKTNVAYTYIKHTSSEYVVNQIKQTLLK